jgi:hypothetical protein
MVALERSITEDMRKEAERAAEAFDSLVSNTEKRISLLEAEAEAMRTVGAQSAFNLNLQSLIAEAESQDIDLTKERIDRLTELADRLTDAQLTVEGLHIALENRSPWEAMAEEITKLNELLDRGKIGIDDYLSSLAQGLEDMAGKYASAANGILGSFSGFAEAQAMMGRERVAALEEQFASMNLTGQAAIDAEKELRRVQDEEGRKAFENEKALSIARAVIAGGESIVKSYNWGTTIGGPVGGAIAAGLAAAATAAQIAAIASTQYHSKTPASAVGGAAPSTPAAAGPSQTVNVTLKGRSYSREDIRELLEQIGGAVGDGMVIKVSQ